MSNHRHEDLNAMIFSVDATNSTQVTAFSGTNKAKIHHMNVYNSSETNSITIHVKAYEGGIQQRVGLRTELLGPEEFFRWQGALGDDDYLTVEGENASPNSIDVHLAWW